MSAPRGLSAEEAALWEKVASTVRPMNPPRSGEVGQAQLGGGESVPDRKDNIAKSRKSPPTGASRRPPPRPGEGQTAIRTEAPKGLDSHWERRLSREQTQPDFTLDLHGHNLDQAYRRLDAGLTQAKAMNARLVLVVTGKPRPVDAADRGAKRGAIRAKILDWLAAGPHASDIAAVRKAHRRHGGDGALYLVLRRSR